MQNNTDSDQYNDFKLKQGDIRGEEIFNQEISTTKVNQTNSPMVQIQKENTKFIKTLPKNPNASDNIENTKGFPLKAEGCPLTCKGPAMGLGGTNQNKNT